VTHITPGRTLTALLLLGMSLVAGGCERSQPGPKPISGAPASGASQSAAPAQPTSPPR